MTDLTAVDVALATYNGAYFLPEFLSSVDAQDWPNVGIVASDDGSTDETYQLLQAFARTRSVHRNARSGIIANFDNALSKTAASYVALADQDDVWRADKLTLMMAAMHAAEEQTPGPVLVFSDLELVDDQLRLIHQSFFDATDKDRGAHFLRDFAIGNHIPGCAMLANRALVDLALPIPIDVRMHDWWIALVAAGLGRIVYVDEPLIKYRQHQSNNMGAPVRRRGLASRLTGLRQRVVGYRDAARDAHTILATFHGRYAHKLASEDQCMLSTMLDGSIAARFRVMKDARTGSGRIASTALQMLYRV